MTEDAILEIKRLRSDFSTLVAMLSPWISTSEMCARYDCTPQTLKNMERSGRIPFRKRDKWSRVEVMDFERSLP